MNRRLGRATMPSALLLVLALLFFWGVVGYSHSAFVPSAASLEAPSAAHWLGADDLGMDIFAQLSHGFYTSMGTGLCAALLSFALGGTLGILAGWRGGKIDAALSFLIHLCLSVPQLPVMIVAGAFFGAGRRNLVVIVTLFSWAPIAAVLRAKTREICRKPYLTLAKSYGGGFFYLLRTHLSAELLPLLTVNALSVIGKAVLQESSLAYLGLCDPTARSWGLMISKCLTFPGIYFTDYWKFWLLPPVLCLLITVLCVRFCARALEKRWMD